jgi:hypothetical protein
LDYQNPSALFKYFGLEYRKSGELVGLTVKDIEQTDQATDITDILFMDTLHPIRLNGAPELLDVINEICPEWPFNASTLNSSKADPFLTITATPNGYHLSSAHMPKPLVIKNGIDAVCAMIVELAWASLRSNPEWLCLHCAAVEFSGRLVLFPNARRAGKSTLATLLGIKGHRVFTDDFLALEVTDKGAIQGISTGTAPRMRTPWPQDFSTNTLEQLEQSKRVNSNQYSYHNTIGTMPTQRGNRLPIGAIVLLDRQDEHAIELVHSPIEQTLQTLILQNFARATNAANILDVLYALVSQVHCFELKYSNAEDAIAHLEETFQNWEDPEPTVYSKDFGDRNDPEFGKSNTAYTQDIIPNQPIAQNSAAVEYQIGDVRFLATPNGKSIFKLDEISNAVWNALGEPITPDDLVDLFCYAFPDQAKSTIQTDVFKLLGDFARNEMTIRDCDTL